MQSITERLTLRDLQSGTSPNAIRNEDQNKPKICKVIKGQALLEKNPAKPGLPGCTVFGEPVSFREGEDVKFPMIPQTEVSRDRLTLSSSIHGIAYKNNNQIILAPVQTMPESTEASNRYVESPVAVHAEGNLYSNTQIVSKQEIAVDGKAEACNLNAIKNIFISGGMQGNQAGKIQTKENVDTKFLNESRVTANEAVFVHGPVILSTIRCKRLFVDGRDAEIVGGWIEAGN